MKNQAEKQEVYKEVLAQVESVVSGETNLIANLANVAAILKQALNFYWVGFYIETDGQLVLGPFQGPLACTRISKGKGVCGTAWQEMSTMVVPNVDEFKGHIACSAESKSEIVVPFQLNNGVVIVLDIDSTKLNDFDCTDQGYLEKLVDILQRHCLTSDYGKDSRLILSNCEYLNSSSFD